MHPKIENNENFGPREKREAQEYYGCLKELMFDLKEKDSIKKKINSRRGEKYISTIEEGMKRGRAINAVLEVWKDKNKTKKFREALADFELGKGSNFPNMWFNLTLATYIFELESFRVSLFQWLKQNQQIARGDLPLNAFIEYVRGKSKKGDKVFESTNIQFRNAIAHGLVWYDGEKVQYASNANFSPTYEMTLLDLIEKKKNANIINQVFLILMADIGKELLGGHE